MFYGRTTIDKNPDHAKYVSVTYLAKAREDKDRIAVYEILVYRVPNYDGTWTTDYSVTVSCEYYSRAGVYCNRSEGRHTRWESRGQAKTQAAAEIKWLIERTNWPLLDRLHTDFPQADQ